VVGQLDAAPDGSDKEPLWPPAKGYTETLVPKRPRALPAEGGFDLPGVRRSIERNPVRAGLVRRARRTGRGTLKRPPQAPISHVHPRPAPASDAPSRGEA
jgi:hypothetical protein